jgi:hypothetical protein
MCLCREKKFPDAGKAVHFLITLGKEKKSSSRKKLLSGKHKKLCVFPYLDAGFF